MRLSRAVTIPRHLFDPNELDELKKNIAEHGVLVPIIVYQARGQSKFSILDGERRYRCVVDLVKDGRKGKDNEPFKLPANVVEPPTKVAALLYMFNIRITTREAWELMPTALSLKFVIEDLGTDDNRALAKLTGLRLILKLSAVRNFLNSMSAFRSYRSNPNPKTRTPRTSG